MPNEGILIDKFAFFLLLALLAFLWFHGFHKTTRRKQEPHPSGHQKKAA